jgi:hypothetical protein
LVRCVGPLYQNFGRRSSEVLRSRALPVSRLGKSRPASSLGALLVVESRVQMDIAENVVRNARNTGLPSKEERRMLHNPFSAAEPAVPARPTDEQLAALGEAQVKAAQAWQASETVAAPIFQRELSPLQVAANMVYTHPFKTIMSIAGPIYGALFYRESTHPSTAHMPLSQRLIHTRVYGQIVAVLSTVAVMGFAKTMEGSGGIYRVEDAQLVRGELRNRRPFYEIGIGSATPQEKEVRRLQEEQRIAAGYEQGRKDSFDLLVPLLYAPMLPLMRIFGRGRVPPERLNMMMLGTIGLALSHAGYIMFSDSTVLVKAASKAASMDSAATWFLDKCRTVHRCTSLERVSGPLGSCTRASYIDVTDRRTDQARARVECSVMWVYTCPCSWHGMRPSNEGHQRGPVCVWVCVSPLVGGVDRGSRYDNRSTVHCDTSVPKINAAGRIIVGRGERKGNKNISICTCKVM